MEQLPDKIEELVHELSVLPYNDMHYEGPPVGALVLTNYVVWLVIATLTVFVIFFLVARREQKRMSFAVESGKVTDLAPTSKFVSMIELGVEFIRDMAIDVIGPKDGPKYTAFLGTFFFMILVSNIYGLVPGGKPFAGTMGATVALALIVWVVFVFVGFKKNGFFGYMKSLIPSGVREMPLAGRIGLGSYIFLLEFISTFIIRPLTQSVRLFANMYAGHIILGVFSAFVVLFMRQFSVANFAVGTVSMLFLIIMYAFEIFVAFIQAYVFTILTAVYIQSSVHASEH
ncbi:MAG TPA: F0F1 ATP synthase subunit A [Coriobacteriia bacterium]|nr:F0F1 ATP synthase subunit A [Coriobacteriia bacterium]